MYQDPLDSKRIQGKQPKPLDRPMSHTSLVTICLLTESSDVKQDVLHAIQETDFSFCFIARMEESTVDSYTHNTHTLDCSLPLMFFTKIEQYD